MPHRNIKDKMRRPGIMRAPADEGCGRVGSAASTASINCINQLHQSTASINCISGP